MSDLSPEHLRRRGTAQAVDPLEERGDAKTRGESVVDGALSSDAGEMGSEPIGAPREPVRWKHPPQRICALGRLDNEVDSAIVRCERFTADRGEPHSALRVLGDSIDELIEITVWPRGLRGICDARLLKRLVLIPSSAFEEQRGGLGEA